MAGEADTVAGVVGCCLQWKKPYEEYFDRDVALGLTIRLQGWEHSVSQSKWVSLEQIKKTHLFQFQEILRFPRQRAFAAAFSFPGSGLVMNVKKINKTGSTASSKTSIP